MNKTVSILGCGWLGLPLAEFLITKGYKVQGSTTSRDKLKLLTSKGINSFLIELNPLIKADNVREFFNSEILIINIPPGGSDNKVSYHNKQVDSVLEEAGKSAISKIIYKLNIRLWK